METERKYYDWEKTMSYQTGTNAEICIVVGAKDIGKTFGLRKKCVERFLKHDELFCEISRTNEEMKAIEPGYFNKLQSEGYFQEYVFKIEKHCGYIAVKPASDEKPEWRLICYFVALTNFQREKKRTYISPKRYIFDEAIIDTLDKHHRYLRDEFLILAQLLDSISRQQPGGAGYYVYLLGNPVDFTSPYFRYLGINKIPDYGYHFYRDKTVLLHFVEPWDSEERKAHTLVGRMLAGDEESKIVFDNQFRNDGNSEIAKKSPAAVFAFAIKWGKLVLAFWRDSRESVWYVSEKLPKNASNVYTLTKRDSTLDYHMISRSSDFMKLVSSLYEIGAIRYESAHIREAFFEILGFIGIR